MRLNVRNRRRHGVEMEVRGERKLLECSFFCLFAVCLESLESVLSVLCSGSRQRELHSVKGSAVLFIHIA